MAYTDIDKPSDYFETVIYTGNGSTLNVGGLDFTQNFTWIKNRSDGTSHFLYDTIRGAGNNKDLRSNSDGAEGSGDGATHGFMSAFRSDGFTVTQGSSTASITNASGNSYASWNWKEQAGVFDIVSYTGNGSNRTISHSLGSVPKMMIVKRRDASASWFVYHVANGNGNVMKLDNEEAVSAYAEYWNSTTPTSSVFSLGTAATANVNNGTFICYLFGNKQGVSHCGSYTGNGNADGAFVYTGFKPAFVMVKNSTASGTSWEIYDNKRDGFNNQNRRLFPNKSDAEPSAQDRLAILSNGFKILTSASHLGSSGASYIYMAFAENPFVTSTGVPATAR